MPLRPPENLANCRKLCPCVCAEVNSTLSAGESAGGPESSTDANAMGLVAGTSQSSLDKNQRSGLKLARSSKAKRSLTGHFLSQGDPVPTRSRSLPLETARPHRHSQRGTLRYPSQGEQDPVTLSRMLNLKHPRDKRGETSSRTSLKSPSLALSKNHATNPIMQSFLTSMLNSTMWHSFSVLSPLLSSQFTRNRVKAHQLPSPFESDSTQSSSSSPSSSSFTSSLSSSSPLPLPSTFLQSSSASLPSSSSSYSYSSSLSSFPSLSPQSSTTSSSPSPHLPFSSSTTSTQHLSKAMPFQFGSLYFTPYKKLLDLKNSSGGASSTNTRHRSQRFNGISSFFHLAKENAFRSQSKENIQDVFSGIAEYDKRSNLVNMEVERESLDKLLKGATGKVLLQPTSSTLKSNWKNYDAPNKPSTFHSTSFSPPLSSNHNPARQKGLLTTRLVSEETIRLPENPYLHSGLTKRASRNLLSASNSADEVSSKETLISPRDTDKATATAHKDATNGVTLLPVEVRLGSNGNVSGKMSPTYPILQYLDNVLVLEVGHDTGSVFLLAELVPELLRNGFNRTADNAKTQHSIYKTSKALHFVSLSILSVMVLEVSTTDRFLFVCSLCSMD